MNYQFFHYTFVFINLGLRITECQELNIFPRNIVEVFLLLAGIFGDLHFVSQKWACSISRPDSLIFRTWIYRMPKLASVLRLLSMPLKTQYESDIHKKTNWNLSFFPQYGKKCRNILAMLGFSKCLVWRLSLLPYHLI